VERLTLAFVAFAPGPSAAIANVDMAIKAAAANVFISVFYRNYLFFI